jgi:hypothetical protein
MNNEKVYSNVTLFSILGMVLFFILSINNVSALSFLDPYREYFLYIAIGFSWLWLIVAVITKMGKR